MALATTLVTPLEMTITTAVAICIVIVTLTLCAIVTIWLFCRLTPGRRRDVIKLAAAVTREDRGLL